MSVVKPRMLPIWFQIAMKEFGVKEIPGEEHHKDIIKYHASTSLKATSDEVPWCSSFVSWCLEQANIESTKNAWARSYLGWGKSIKRPVIGCIAVFKRGESSGHVGFYFDETKDMVLVYGGNQRNEVSFAWYPKTRLLGYRVPKEYSIRPRKF